MTRIMTSTNYTDDTFDVAEDYIDVRNAIDNCVSNHLEFIELHLNEGQYAHNPILIKISTIIQIFDVTIEKQNKTNYNNIIEFIKGKYGITNLAQLLVVKKDKYNYTSNLLFENFPDRQSAVNATIDKLEDIYDIEKFGFMDKIFKEDNPDYE